MSLTFTARQVVDLTGMGQPVLTDLLKRGVVSPTKHRGEGSGDNHLFDVLDVFGIAAVQHVRPKSNTTDLLRAIFTFWHSDDGRRIVEGPQPVDGVVVIDAKGKVALEEETDVRRLAAVRESPTLFVIEPNRLREDLFSDLGMFRMAGTHAEPLPSGREPRRKDRNQPAAKVDTPERGAERRRSGGRARESAQCGKGGRAR